MQVDTCYLYPVPHKIPKIEFFISIVKVNEIKN